MLSYITIQQVIQICWKYTLIERQWIKNRVIFASFFCVNTKHIKPLHHASQLLTDEKNKQFFLFIAHRMVSVDF